MRLKIQLTAVVLLMILGSSVRLNAQAKSAGTVLLVGGGPTPPAAMKAFIARAGGEDAPIVILAQVGEDPARGGPLSRELFLTMGARNVEAPVQRTNQELRALLAEARGVWIPGGNQNRFADLFPESSGIPEAIRGVWKRGGIVGGTSAGASLMGEWMPTGEPAAVEGVKEGGSPLRAGLNVLPGLIIDQHFFARNRLMRLFAALLEHPKMVGIGIEQGGWCVLQNGKLCVEAEQIAILRVQGRVNRQGKNLGVSHAEIQVLLPGETASAHP